MTLGITRLMVIEYECDQEGNCEAHGKRRLVCGCFAKDVKRRIEVELVQAGEGLNLMAALKAALE